MRALTCLLLLLPVAAGAAIPSQPDLGTAAGACRAGESGPAFLVTAIGLKDRKGTLRVEVYPANDADFLADDNVLVAAGKTFRRVEVPVPASGPVVICVRVPGPGAYTAFPSFHDRDRNRKFSLASDGLGFPSDPPLHLVPPPASAARALAGRGPTPLAIRLNYHHGLFAFGPIRGFPPVKIVDVCAFYAPKGGGVRTYIEGKLIEGPRAGHEVVVIAPGPRSWTEHRGPGARIVLA